MSTQLSTKLTALAVALMVNGIMMGGVALLFSADPHRSSPVKATAMAAQAHTALPRI